MSALFSGAGVIIGGWLIVHPDRIVKKLTAFAGVVLAFMKGYEGIFIGGFLWVGVMIEEKHDVGFGRWKK